MGLKVSPTRTLYGDDVMTLAQVTTDAPLNKTLISQLETLSVEEDWIQVVSPEVYVFCVQRDNPIVVRGVNASAFLEIEDAQIIEGDMFDDRSAMIGEGFSKLLDVQMGDRILLTGSTSPSIKEVKVVGIYSSPTPSNDEMIISIHTASKLARIRDDTVMAIRVKTSDGDRLTEFLQENKIPVVISSATTMPDVLNSNVTYDGRLLNLLFEYTDTTVSQDLSLTTAFINQGVSSVNIVVIAFIVLNVALTFVGVSAILARAIVEKKREIGILSAIGADKAKIRMILLRDIIIILIPSIIVGVTVGLLLAQAIGSVNLIMVFGHSIKPLVDWVLIIEIAVLVIIVSSIVGLFINEVVLKSKPGKLIQETEEELHELDRLEDVLA
jgi:ABC-type lipoprotein release transport system permease subunit